MTMRRLRSVRALSLIAGVGWLLAARSAHAGLNGDSCKVLEPQYGSWVTTSGGVITAKATNPTSVTVVCPVPKTTSGPGIYNDQLQGATIVQTSARAGDVSCVLREYLNTAQSVNDLVSLGEASVSSTAAGTKTLSVWGFSWDTLWDMHAAADLVCQLKANASIASYAWTENGPAQTYRLYPAVSCSPSSDSAYLYMTGSSGYWEGKTGAFKVSCPIPATDGRGVEIELGPPVGPPNFMACTYDGVHFVDVPKNPGSVAFPTQRLQFAVGPGAQAITCRKTGTNEGDPLVFGYRTFPLTRLEHTSWKATASLNNGTAQNAVDDTNTGDRWTTGTGQSNTPAESQWFQVNLGAAKTFHEIVLGSSASANDYPRGYNVYASNNTSSWGTPIASGVGTGDVVTIPVPPTTAQYIRITQTSNTPARWWSISKVDVYVAKTP